MAKETIPPSLINLAYANSQALSRYGIPHTRVKNDRELSIKYGMQYLNSVLPPESYDMTPGEVPPRSLDDVDDNNRTVIEQIVKRGVAMVLIRPEMYHTRGDILDFLVREGFQIVIEKDATVNTDQLYRLYRSVIRNVRHFIRELPTRAVVYTDSPAALVLLTDPVKRYGDKPEYLTNGFFGEYKGAPAVYGPRTIRGGVVYNSALRLGFDKPSETIGMATDPFGALAHLVNEPEPHWYHANTPQRLRMLRYTAQGVHIPNLSELPGDLDVLASRQELLEIHGILTGKLKK